VVKLKDITDKKDYQAVRASLLRCLNKLIEEINNDYLGKAVNRFENNKEWISSDLIRLRQFQIKQAE